MLTLIITVWPQKAGLFKRDRVAIRRVIATVAFLSWLFEQLGSTFWLNIEGIYMLHSWCLQHLQRVVACF